MELSLINNDSSHTLLVAQDGPKYKITTPQDVLGVSTTITRIEGELSTGLVGTEIGKVEHSAPRGTRLLLCTTNMELVLYPYDASSASENSWSFTGPDNRPYKWQIFIQSPVLMLNDNSHTLLARYRRAKLGIVSRSRRAFLEILPAGLSSVDLIVVTFVSFMKQRVTIEYHSPS
ncbi:hypothetical protein BDZ94DRAFT_610254 [Collybia nuda]|uniref:DUF6593 domain-containing protein n=1 Tax=Collybia nuda TaxID=64659 RepID=A0A9P5Y762_9AGAR|nr:hypothetical protein BDZ94DRAFT_610254 [Collybia nuda]